MFAERIRKMRRGWNAAMEFCRWPGRHRDPATTDELKRILWEHVESARQSMQGAMSR
jgi:hypothetical protein